MIFGRPLLRLDTFENTKLSINSVVKKYLALVFILWPANADTMICPILNNSTFMYCTYCGKSLLLLSNIFTKPIKEDLLS